MARQLFEAHLKELKFEDQKAFSQQQHLCRKANKSRRKGREGQQAVDSTITEIFMT